MLYYEHKVVLIVDCTTGAVSCQPNSRFRYFQAQDPYGIHIYHALSKSALGKIPHASFQGSELAVLHPGHGKRADVSLVVILSYAGAVWTRMQWHPIQLYNNGARADTKFCLLRRARKKEGARNEVGRPHLGGRTLCPRAPLL